MDPRGLKSTLAQSHFLVWTSRSRHLGRGLKKPAVPVRKRGKCTLMLWDLVPVLIVFCGLLVPRKTRFLRWNSLAQIIIVVSFCIITWPLGKYAFQGFPNLKVFLDDGLGKTLMLMEFSIWLLLLIRMVLLARDLKSNYRSRLLK